MSELKSGKLTGSNLTILGVITRFFVRRWTNWELLHIYNFSTTNRSIEVRQDKDDGTVQFRVRKITNPVDGKQFDVDDVKRALGNVL